MINNTESKKVYEVQSGVTEYPIGFPFHFNADQTPQLSVVIGHDVLRLNYNCKLSEDKGTLILIPTEEEAEKLTGPDDYSWMDKWVGAHLVIERDIPFVQESDYQLGRISAEQIEHDFDASVMRDQMLADKIGEHTTDVSEELESLHTDISDINAELAAKATKTELDNYKLATNAAIDANAAAIQKTREDYINADSEIHQILNNHASELTTLRGNQASLGDQVSGIEEKIPESASGSNPLITKQQLLNEEMDIREDLNEGLSELQTQITAQAAEIAGKQDELIPGDNIIISGNIISATGAGGGAGFDIVVVQELPATGQKGIIYLLAKDGTAPDVYDEYAWITATQTFELIGTTQVDLSGYLPTTGGTGDGKYVFKLLLDNAYTAGKVIELAPYTTSRDLTKSTISVGNGFMFLGTDNCLTIHGIARYLAPDSNGNWKLGKSEYSWQNVYTQKLNNGADLIVPAEGGTLARREDITDINNNSINTQDLTVGTGEGTINIGVVAGTATIATNNGLDFASHVKFDHAPTTDDNTTYADALDTSMVRKAQVATAIADAVANIDALTDQTGNAGKVLTTDGTTASWQEPAGGTKVIFREWEE